MTHSTTQPTAAPPVQYTVPKISGDPIAAYELASAFLNLSQTVDVAHQRVGAIVSQLADTWAGTGHDAVSGPVTALLRNAFALSAALEEASSELHAYGVKLATASEHHGFSLHKLLKVGAVVAVSATAIIVTVGVAGAVEAAAAAAAVTSAAEAAGAATAADAAAAGAFDAALEDLATIRPLLAFVLPHLVQSAWASGATAVWEEVSVGRLSWKAIGESGGVAFVASGVAEKSIGLAGDTPWMPPLVQGTVWAGAAGTDDELIERRLDIADLAESFVLAGGGTAGRDLFRAHGMWPEEPDYRRQALIKLLHSGGLVTNPEIAHELAMLRQPERDLLRGEIDLWLNEGPGHTIDRHVAKSAQDLLNRVRTDRIRVASTYWDRTIARDSIDQTLLANRALIKKWVTAGCPGTLRLRLTTPYDIGFAIDKRGIVRFVRRTTVILRRDHSGIVLVTSYPIPGR